MKILSLGLCAQGLMACGYTDPGSGSKTLQVEASAEYEVGDSDRMRVTVTVHDKDDAPVEWAIVELRDGKTGEIITAEYESEGVYRASMSAYRRRLELRVESSGDELTAKLEGPGPHRILDPKAGAMNRASFGPNLRVKWATTDGIRADEVRLRVHGQRAVERVLTEDGGSYDGIAISELPSVGDYRLTVERVNVVELAGGIAGSVFTIHYNVNVDFSLIN